MTTIANIALSLNFNKLNLLKFRERAVFPKCETSEGLCAKARDFKLMCSIDLQQLFRGNKMLLAEGAKGWLKHVRLDVENLQECRK